MHCAPDMQSQETVRLAGPEDVPALSELVERVEGSAPGESRAEVQALLDGGYTLVLPQESGDIGGAAHLEIAGDVGHLDFLIVAPEVDTASTEERLVAIAEAMCQAYGCRSLDVIGHRRSPRHRARAVRTS
jgi:N-acetylglutamate synthase-like GNAT family acetyltransferase